MTSVFFSQKQEFPNAFPKDEGWKDQIMQTSFLKRTWIEIDLDAIVHNYKEAYKLCGEGTKLTCVLKSNAYGHGAVHIAWALQATGAQSFAVSCIREAFELRRAGIASEILVMTVTEEDALPEAIRQGIHLTVASYPQAAMANSAAALLGSKAILHVKVDTGMHRLGFIPGPQAVSDILAISRMKNVQIQGLYSHLALTNGERDQLQHDVLRVLYDTLLKEGLHIPEMHLCDSIGLTRYPQWRYQRVRVGAFLYGVRPLSSQHMDFITKEALCLKTRVAQVLPVKAGETVGYDDKAPLVRDSVIATLCAGYGDGYPRCMSRVASVMIRGQLAPVLGLVCMDQMMVDVTDIPGVCEGDETVLLGGGISYMQYADWANTNRNEAITIMSRRPPRVYMRNGKVIDVVDYLMYEGVAAREE